MVVRVVYSLISLTLKNVFGFVLFSLLAAWLLTLAFPIAFSQALWLSLGVIFIINYLLQELTDLPGQITFGALNMIVSAMWAYFILLISGGISYLLSFMPLDLTTFEILLLATVSMTAGTFFKFRSGSVKFPGWMTLPFMDIDDEFYEDDDEDDYIIQPPPPPPPKPKGRPSRRRRRR